MGEAVLTVYVEDQPAIGDLTGQGDFGGGEEGGLGDLNISISTL